MKMKNVIFDLDGTLVDTAPDFLESLNNILRNHNKECVSMDELRPYISEGTSKLVKLFFKINENDKILICTKINSFLSMNQI